VAEINGEVKEKILDLHDVTHCVGSDGKVAGQSRLHGGFEVRSGACDQEREA
jgi:hypothetical protein